MHETSAHERANRNGFARSWRMHTTDDRWDIYRYVVTILWAVAFLVFTPAALQPVLVPATTWIPLMIVIAGAAVGIVGRWRNDHLRIELWGAVGVVSGFGFYLLLNLLLVFLASVERVQQFLLVFLAMSFAVERVRVLGPRLLAVLRGEDDES